MTVTVIIAEKPSLARAISAALPRSPDTVIVAARGHLLEPAGPDDYLRDDIPRTKSGAKVWRWQDLPIIPVTWRRHPRADAKQSLDTIRAALDRADRVINAGDPDREGQLLIDELLDEFRFRGQVDRVWLRSLTPDAIRAAFSSLRPNSEYQPLSRAAEARQRADWLIGMNLTRAYTLSTGALLSVGRVQTPTLSLIVTRDAEIEKFTPHDFFEVRARVRHAAGEFDAKWVPASTDGPGFDPDGRLLDRSTAQRIADAAAGGPGVVCDYKAERKTRPAPLPFSLSSLQKTASARLGLGAQQVLDIAQSLYEAKLTTYPRTDCRYLPEDQIPNVRAAAEKLAAQFGVTLAGPGAKPHAAFDSKKVTAHTGLVPTGGGDAGGGGLSGAEAALYDLIARSAVALFMPPQEFTVATATTELAIANEKWAAQSRSVTAAGWTALYKSASAGGGKDDADAALALPEMKPGDAVECASAVVVAKKTTPPQRFTEGTIIDAMSSIHRYITDPAAKAKLKETSGIGTEATRARIIETLFKRGWVEKKGKTVISTAAGRAVIATVPRDLSDPAMTARWEDALTAIAESKVDAALFEKKIADRVRALVAQVPAPAPRTPREDLPTAACPVCGGATLVRRLESKKKPGVFFWACENRKHGLLADDAGKPGKEFGKSKSGNSGKSKSKRRASHKPRKSTRASAA